LKHTINDIARITGYSKSSVSSAINNKPGVSKKTREYIMSVVKKMNYTPNEHAQNISRGSYRTVAIIVRDIANPFYAKMCRSVEEIAEEKGYSTIIVNTGGNDERLMRSLNNLIRKRVEGVIVDVSNYNFEFSELIKSHFIKCVVFGIDSKDFDSVEADDNKASYNMALHLVNSGYKSLTFVCPILERNVYSKRRIEGIKRLVDSMPDVEFKTIYYDDSSSVHTGYDIAKEVVEILKPPAAIMAFNDLVAIGIIQYLMGCGYLIPEDYIVTGFDNIDSILFSLNTVNIPVYEMGECAAKMLFERIQNPDKEIQTHVFDAELILKGR